MQDLIQAINNSELTCPAVAREYGINYNQLRRYLRGQTTPRQSTLTKLEAIMTDLSKRPAATRHPSYGYATPEQIEQLKTLGIGPTRDKLLADIAKANKKKGKK